MIFNLSNDEKGRMRRLNQDQAAVFALKKLFMNTALRGTIPADVQTLAAERIALDIIQDSFKELNTIQPDTQIEEKVGNLV